MYNVAIIEDEPDVALELQNKILFYQKETKTELKVSLFDSMESFFSSRGQQFEIVFFDIELPGENGMSGARKFRAANPDSIIFFTTNLRQYVLKGYEVEAMDYLLKPIKYDNLKLKLTKAVNKLESSTFKTVMIRNKDEIVKLRTIDIYYIEVQGHAVTVHSDSGNYESTGKLGDLENELDGYGFYRCKSCYLVNMRYIKKIDDLDIYLENGEKIFTSRRKKKEFMDAFTEFIGS